MSKMLPPNAPRRKSHTTFKTFSKYENGRVRRLRFDINALADFEQETGMGLGQLMKQRAAFAALRAMAWAGLKHEDRGLTLERVGNLVSEYLNDEDVVPGDHSIDAIMTEILGAAVEQGALGIQKPEPVVDFDIEDEAALGSAEKKVDALPPTDGGENQP